MAPVSVRPFREGDYVRVLTVWQEGFEELATVLVARLRSPLHVAAVAAIAIAALALERRTVAAAAAAWAAFVLSPLADAAARAALWRGISAQTREDMAPIDNFRRHWLRPGQSAFFVAELDGLVVGCAGVKTRHACYKEGLRWRGSAAPADADDAASQPCDASVWRVGVDRHVRRAGAGAALMRAVEAWAAKEGCSRVSLVTGNPASKRFYRALGYESEALARARAVVFGASGGWLAAPRLYLLRSRVRDGNIMVKELKM